MLSPFSRTCARPTSVLRCLVGTPQTKRCLMHKNPDDVEIPPEPTTCCMSGCSNCVWIAYAMSLSKLFEHNDERAKQIVLSKITDPNLKMFLTIELRFLKQLRENEGARDEGFEQKPK